MGDSARKLKDNMISAGGPLDEYHHSHHFHQMDTSGKIVIFIGLVPIDMEPPVLPALVR